MIHPHLFLYTTTSKIAALHAKGNFPPPHGRDAVMGSYEHECHRRSSARQVAESLESAHPVFDAVPRDDGGRPGSLAGGLARHAGAAAGAAATHRSWSGGE